MDMRRGLSGLIAAVALGIALALPSGAFAFDVEVKSDDATTTFTPSTVEIEPGQTVRWTFHPNASGGPILATHNVAIHPGVDDSQAAIATSDYFSPDGSDGVTPEPGWFEYTFDTPGTYFFVCQVHAGSMFGTVTVEAPGPELTTLETFAKPKSVSIKPKKAAKIKANVANPGGAVATNVKVCAKAPKKLLKVRGKACANLGGINPEGSKKATFKFKPTKKAKGKKVNVKLVVTADNAPKVTAKATVKVKKK
jgi:plastocyanin